MYQLHINYKSISFLNQSLEGKISLTFQQTQHRTALVIDFNIGTMLANHSTYLAGLINPAFTSLSISSLTFSSISFDILHGACFIGLYHSLIGILCFTKVESKHGISKLNLEH